MKRLHCIIMLCAALLALGSMPLAAQSTGDTFTKDNLKYEITATGANPKVEFTGIADVSSVTGDVTIPASVTNDDVTYSVTSLSKNCFNNCDLSGKTITVQAAITTINQAFSAYESTDFFKCAKVDLSACTNLTTAGGYAFSYAEIDEIVLPNTVTQLAQYSFTKGKYKKLDFSNCTALTVINKAFGNSTIDELILPASLTTINTTTRALDDLTCKRLDFSRCEKLTTVNPL